MCLLTNSSKVNCGRSGYVDGPAVDCGMTGEEPALGLCDEEVEGGGWRVGVTG